MSGTMSPPPGPIIGSWVRSGWSTAMFVFDPRRYPDRSATFYAPAGQELGTPARLRTVLDAHGVEHAVLVGPNSGYGEDNRCLLNALAEGGRRYRGMAVVPNSTTRAEPCVDDRRRILWDTPVREFGFAD